MQKFNTVLLTLLAFGVTAYAAIAYTVLPLGSLVHPAMRAVYLTHQAGIYTHIFAALVALALGPFQFSARLRTTHPQRHRWIGRVYLICVLFGGLAALYMAQFAFGGLVSQLGFGCLAIAWLYSGVRGYLAIRQGKVVDHRRWMIRNFSLTCAAITLRIYLPLSIVAGLPFEMAYPMIAWLCWVPNLVIVEWRFHRQ